MFIVALYFLIVTILSYGIGLGIQGLLKVTFSFIETLLLGLSGITIWASLWAIFLPLGIYFSLFTLFVAGLSIVLFTDFTTIQAKLNSFLFNGINLLLLIFLVFMVSLAASMPAYALDNELYYIQTIKWLDEYGFVRGLSNLYILFAQQSGVHVLQAALNFDSFYSNFNDISAYFLLIGLCWSAFAKAESQSKLLSLFKHFFPLGLFLFLLFSTAPTSDIPVYVLSYYVIYKFLVLWLKNDNAQLLMMAICCFLIAYFKVTATLIFLLPFVILIKNKSYINSVFIKILGCGLLFLSLFIVKNLIVSGLPLYPLTTWTPVHFSWQVNTSIAMHFADLTEAQPFHTWASELAEVSFFGKIKLWLFHEGFDTYLNWFTLLSCIAGFIFFLKTKDRSLQVVMAVFLLQSILLFFTSPQFRFFFNLLYPLVILILLIGLQKSKRFSNALIAVGYGAGLLVFVAPQLIQFFTDNPAMKNNVRFKKSMLVEPSLISIFSKAAQKSQEGNLLFYHSVEDGNFWSTNDMPLPAVQPEYIDYYKKYFNSRPQLRTSNLKDGFYSDTNF